MLPFFVVHALAAQTALNEHLAEYSHLIILASAAAHGLLFLFQVWSVHLLFWMRYEKVRGETHGCSWEVGCEEGSFQYCRGRGFHPWPLPS